MKTKYKNKWHKQNSLTTQEYFETDSNPVEYGGFLIYERNDTGYSVFDIVFNGICIGQYNGLNGAKRAIETNAV